MRTLSLTACECAFTIACGDNETAALVTAAFGGLLAPTTSVTAKPPSHVKVDVSESRFRVEGFGACPDYYDDPCSFLFHLDKFITISLQLERPDLYFVHAASVARNGRVAVISAPSGTGKSTLALALLKRGFTVLSDELAPVDAQTGTVHPYARALRLKSAPPPPYEVPFGTIETNGHAYVPVTGASMPVHRDGLPLAALVFLRRGGAHRAAKNTCRSITPAQAAAHLMSNALNPLAHGGYGLDVAVKLGQITPCFELDSTDLPTACAAVETILLGDDDQERGRSSMLRRAP